MKRQPPTPFIFVCVFVPGLVSLASGCSEGTDLRGLEPGPRGEVRSVDSSNALVLDGGVVRLAEIEILPARDADTSPSSQEANILLGRIATGQRIRLAFGGLRQRDDFTLAHVFVLRNGKPAVWLQEELTRAGLARVRSWPDNRARTMQLLRIEAGARAARRGIWREQGYQIHDAEKLAEAGAPRPSSRSFILVEGMVMAAEERKDRLYLNFGEDWRTDFTASAASDALALWPRGGADLLALQGRRIRLRGSLYWRNGPAIELTHPEQIEILK